MEWDSADGRYKQGLSESITLADTTSYTTTTDVFDSLILIGVIDTLYNPLYQPLNSLLFVDRSEWQRYDTIIYDESESEQTIAENFYLIILELSKNYFRLEI